ncbi:MAG: hypothetical protein V1775_04835 [Bacteroidota bacterium]
MKSRKAAWILSALILLISMGVYIYLFGFADRNIVFLYGHMGLTPFDSMTAGRYWMAGFVLSGFLTLLYLIVRLAIRAVFRALDILWVAVVKYLWLPIFTGVVVIMMTSGTPRLPFSIAISSALALLTGIMTGFSVADDLISDFRSGLAYMVTALGLVPFLLLFRVLELPEKGIVETNVSIMIAILTLVAGFVWLLVSFRVFRQQRPDPVSVIKGALASGYVGLPVVHYLLATPPGIPYITSSDNFFADNMLLRVTNWLLLILIVLLADKLTKRKLPVEGRGL